MDTATLDTLRATQNLLPVGLVFFLEKMLLPILVALVTYIAVDRLGEWRRRRTYSKLGVAILESIQEEVQVGLRTLKKAAEAADDTSTGRLPSLPGLPHQSWSDMSSIPDDVLLRIIETSEGKEFAGFHPRDCRIHCKNHFEHIRQNYKLAVQKAVALGTSGKDWRPPISEALRSSARIDAVEGVNQMLEDAKNLLKKNSLKWRPK